MCYACASPGGGRRNVWCCVFDGATNNCAAMIDIVHTSLCAAFESIPPHGSPYDVAVRLFRGTGFIVMITHEYATTNTSTNSRRGTAWLSGCSFLFRLPRPLHFLLCPPLPVNYNYDMTPCRTMHNFSVTCPPPGEDAGGAKSE